MKRSAIKREVDLQILGDWVSEGARVLDLGCGRGIFLEYLRQTKHIYGVGLDNQIEKVGGCVKRGVNVYQGDIETSLRQFSDGFFDWVLCSRTLQELARPQDIIRESLRVGKRFAVGFVNHGYWRNRVHMFRHGRRVVNEVFPEGWGESRPLNPVTVGDFEDFCAREGLVITRRAYLRGDWHTPCTFLPSWLAGYVLYEITKSDEKKATD
ncbi:methionine biosynthesis protein MetW [Ruficoccus sp. ZRK36]|uniref:methionine biosynthesis protein MetW n=1 Tax=Ruficoccus sp. ZRK36 TaxID=2866311 RepID=UPI001C73495E|nr:methionine biosynthesis protein MetW [Ruficoccus sp. ZRK36]QYY36918.1 methionine biosynthesis protein MetW [Ruficoccus sp. ZRK36]